MAEMTKISRVSNHQQQLVKTEVRCSMHVLGKAVSKESIDGKSKNSPTCKLRKVKYNLIVLQLSSAWTNSV